VDYPLTSWDDEEILEEEAETALDTLPSWQPAASYDELDVDDDDDSDDDLEID